MKFNVANKILKKKFYIDSRLVKENSVFLCIKGPNNDGHKYAKLILDRFKRTIIICEKNSIYLKNLKKSNRVIFCNSTKDFLINLARINVFHVKHGFKPILLIDDLFFGIDKKNLAAVVKLLVYIKGNIVLTAPNIYIDILKQVCQESNDIEIINMEQKL